MREYANRIQNIYCDKCEDEECLECNAIGIAQNIENEIRVNERTQMLMPYDVEDIDELIANVRAKVIDEFAEAMIKLSNKRRMHDIYADDIKEIAERIKEG